MARQVRTASECRLPVAFDRGGESCLFRWGVIGRGAHAEASGRGAHREPEREFRIAGSLFKERAESGTCGAPASRERQGQRRIAASEQRQRWPHSWNHRAPSNRARVPAEFARMGSLPKSAPANAHRSGPSVKWPVMCSTDRALRPGAIYRSTLGKAINFLILPRE